MKFSFVVIARNNRNTICAAIQSALNQDYTNIEVIYVDDASTDGSMDLVRQSFDDSRLMLIENEQNCGSVVSRLDGIARASGDWVLFLDGDDCYSPQACSVLAEAIGRADEDVEIFGFGTDIRYMASIPDSVKVWSERMFSQAVPGLLTSGQLLDELYLHRNRAWVVWSRCYSIDLARRVAKLAVRERMIQLDDFYLSFIISSLTKGYQGLGEKLYQYSYGTGISTSVVYSLESLEQYLLLKTAVNRTREYAGNCGLYERYRDVIDAVEQEGIIGSCWRLEQLKKSEKPVALRMILESFDGEKILSALKSSEYFSAKVEAVQYPPGRCAEDKIRRIFMIRESKGIKEDLARLAHNLGELPQSSSLYQYILWLNDFAENKDAKFWEEYLPIIQKEKETFEGEKPFLTVVMRTQGKRPEMLREAILSLAGQSDEDFELLLIGHKLDDDARVLVGQILAEQPACFRERIHLIEVDYGERAVPLNVGFANAHGDYIAVLDDDDVVFDNWVELFHEASTENNGKILHSYVVTQEWKALPETSGGVALFAASSFGTEYCCDFNLIKQMTRNRCPLMSLAFPAYYFQQLGIIFDEMLTTTEDWDYLMRLSFLAGVTDIPQTTAIYRMWINVENSSTVHNQEEWDKNYNIIKEKFRKLPVLLPPSIEKTDSNSSSIKRSFLVKVKNRLKLIIPRRFWRFAKKIYYYLERKF